MAQSWNSQISKTRLLAKHISLFWNKYKIQQKNIPTNSYYGYLFRRECWEKTLNMRMHRNSLWSKKNKLLSEPNRPAILIIILSTIFYLSWNKFQISSLILETYSRRVDVSWQELISAITDCKKQMSTRSNIIWKNAENCSLYLPSRYKSTWMKTKQRTS